MFGGGGLGASFSQNSSKPLMLMPLADAYEQQVRGICRLLMPMSSR
jgi:hypothetical protein